MVGSMNRALNAVVKEMFMVGSINRALNAVVKEMICTSCLLGQLWPMKEVPDSRLRQASLQGVRPCSIRTNMESFPFGRGVVLIFYGKLT